MKTRPNTSDDAIWSNVVLNNEYKLPEIFPEDSIVIDVGAHIGAFSFTCAMRRVEAVYGFEPDKDNFELASTNTSDLDGVFLRQAAIWGNNPTENLRLSDYPVLNDKEINTGGASLVWGRGGNTIEQILPLDRVVQTIVDYHKKPIYLLKLDCEGSEWSILYSATCLDVIDRICGEYHEAPKRAALHSWTEHALVGYLIEKGFDVETKRHGNSNLGMFFARRRVK